MIDKMEDVCLVKIGLSYHKFEKEYVKREHLEVGVYQRSCLESSG